MPGIITKVISRVGPGNVGLNLPPIDPLKINAINIAQGASSPVSIQLDLMNQDIYGLKDIKVTKVRGFEKNPEGVFEVGADLAQIKLIGDYKIDGRVLVLPIQGHGKSNLTLNDLTINIRFRMKPTQKKNGLYVKTDKFKFTMETKKMYINLENLFNGDKALSDNMNLFLNENWQDILQELKPSIQDAFSQIIGSLVNSVFAKVAYSDIFLD